MTTALVVDDHPLLLKGCTTVLNDLGIEEVVGATSVVGGYRAFLRHSPDIVILDLTFEGDDLGGLSLISRITRADKKARILVLSMHNDATIISRALEAGALSYVIKDSITGEFTTAIEKVLRGEQHLSHQLAMRIVMLRGKAESHDSPKLTSRESQILSLLGRGNGYDQIAEKLGISYKTVTNSCSNMRSKLNITSLAELIRFAIKVDA